MLDWSFQRVLHAQVLDRLNPLLEPGGELLLNEAGAPGGRARVLRPHPAFRLVLAVDPRCAAWRAVVSKDKNG